MQSLGIRQDCCAQIALDIALIGADQSVEQSRVLTDVGIEGGLVAFGGAVHDTRIDLGAEGQGEDHSADAGGGGITSADVVIHEECFQIVSAGGQRRGLAGDGQHVFGRIHACVAQSVAHKCLIGQCLQCRTGLGNNDEEGVRNIDGFQDSCRIVGVDVADETGFHLEGVVGLCPVLECQIDGAGTQVASADTDLHSSGELLACSVGDLTGMDLVGKVCGLFLLGSVEVALVDAVSDDIACQLSAAELMENETLLTGVDDFAAQESFVFVDQLLLVSQLLKDFESMIIDCLGSKVVLHTACHGNGVFGNALGAAFSGHSLYDVDAAFQSHKLVINGKCVQVFPGNHLKCPPSLRLLHESYSSLSRDVV